MRNLTLTLFAISMLVSCKKDTVTSQEQLDIDVEIIEAYLSDNNITALSDQNVYYVIDEEGTGSDYPTISSKVTVAYSGKVMNGDGTIFDSANKINPFTTFLSGNIISGWKVGIPKFKKGGKGTLYIPSGYAYGVQAIGSDIPGNSILIFEVELLDFIN